MSEAPESTSPEATLPTGQADLAKAEPTPAFGWSAYAERINGRFAMVGFVALLLLELISGQTFFSWLGF